MRKLFLVILSTLVADLLFSQSIPFVAKDAITVLPAYIAERKGGLPESKHQDLDKNQKVFAVEGWKNKEQSFTWNINAAEKALYKVAILLQVKGLSGEAGSTLQISSLNGKINLRVGNTAWDKKYFAGPILLEKGINQLQLHLTDIPENQQPEIAVYSIEIGSEQAWKKNSAAARQLRSKPEWLTNSNYGLFFHWNARSQPRVGEAKSYADAVRDFDVTKFAEMVHETGADFIVLTTSWDLQTFPAPLKSLDDALPGNTTPRDLISDLSAALSKKDMKLIVYCNFRMNKMGWKKGKRFDPGAPDTVFNKLLSIYREIGKRYAHKIGGIWIDDGMGLYPHNVSFEAITRAIKQYDGNMVVGYNSWIYPRFTDFQDFYGGEMGINLEAAGINDKHLPVGGNGYFISGPQKGLKATFCGLLEPGDWTHTRPNTAIPAPLLTSERLIGIIREAMSRKNTAIMNVSIYQDGSISPETFALLKQLKKAVLTEKR